MKTNALLLEVIDLGDVYVDLLFVVVDLGHVHVDLLLVVGDLGAGSRRLILQLGFKLGQLLSQVGDFGLVLLGLDVELARTRVLELLDLQA